MTRAAADQPVKLGSRGIVTACDAHYFQGLLLLHESVQQSMTCPTVAYDLGLTTDQLDHARGISHLRILPLPADDLILRIQKATQSDTPLHKPGKRIWPLWICPILIEHAPFDDVYWLDCDLLVLRHLDVMFAELANGPVFTPENKAPQVTANDSMLYERAPIARPFDPRIPLVNGGVSGWRKSRDGDVLAAYRYLVDRASTDPRLRELISWHDQGCLIWAIQQSGLESRVLEIDAWNRCVDNTPLSGQTLPFGRGFLEAVRQAVPDAAIVHWNGSEPPWVKPGSAAPQ